MFKFARCARMVWLGMPLVVLAQATHAADPNPIGTWHTEGGEATIRIARCGEALCGRITALREPRDPATGRPKTDEHNPDPQLRSRPLIGLQIVIGMRRKGRSGHWNGRVYNPEDGRIYPATLTMVGGRSLRLKGCMAEGVLCQGQTWTRIK